MDDRRQLATLGLRYAEILDRGGGTVGAGIVRRLAAALLDSSPVSTGPDCCRGCGTRLEQPDTGRRRVWCAEACRSRTRRRLDRQPTGYPKVGRGDGTPGRGRRGRPRPGPT